MEYAGGFQYENGALQFLPTSEGYYDFTKNAYIYNYVDHLGNVRLSFEKNSAGGLDILEENNYYPFGLKHEGYNGTMANNPNYNYKFGGKELQETGFYDYGARFYMPDIGKWGVTDPLAETSRRWSPYAYAYNNPMRFIDPNGMQNEDWVKRTGMSNWEYRSDIHSQAEATKAGFSSYADGRGDANSSYTTTFARNGVDTGISQKVVLGEGGNYTVNGESFKDKDHYTDMTPVENLEKFLAAPFYGLLAAPATPMLLGEMSTEAIATKGIISVLSQSSAGKDIDIADVVMDATLTNGASNFFGSTVDYTTSGTLNVYGIYGNKTTTDVVTEISTGYIAEKAGGALSIPGSSSTAKALNNMMQLTVQSTKSTVNSALHKREEPKR